MSNENYNPTFKQPIPSLNPAKPEIPKELKELDDAAIGGVRPEGNSVGGGITFPEAPKQELTDAQKAEALADTEFNLHPDGTLAKHTPRPAGLPGRSVVDGHGRILCVARNEDVAELICNGVNYFHMASVQAFQQQRIAAGDALQGELKTPSGLILPPPIIIDPRTTPGQ